MRYLPAGDVFLMEPAGEIWSVVTLSPKMASGRAPLMGLMLPGVNEKFSKNGGSWMYVDLRSHSYTLPVLDGISFHFGFWAAKSLYNLRKTSGCKAVCMRSRTSFRLGQ